LNCNAIIVYGLLLGLGFPAFLGAADKNGVSPGAISVPKGPGSIEGLGESFQPSLNTGTAKYNVGIKLPPGTAGHAPALHLSYEGGGGNGPLGYGWSLPTAFIQRRTDHGIPTYGENLGFLREDTFINEMREELVPQTNGFYFCKNEGAFIRYRQVGDHWEATEPDGSRLEFGVTANGRIEDPANGHVFCWLLERETDTHSNVIVYAYSSFPGDPNRNQKYLTAIRYGPGGPPWSNSHFARLEYEDRPDWFEDCRAGFIMRTGKRLKSIWIGTQGPALANHLQGDFDADGIPDFLDRRYDLEYLHYAGTNSHWSLLAKIVPVGADGVSTLPASSFGYAVCDPPDLLSAADKIIGGTNEPAFVMDNELVELVDLNGDGLPDVLKTDLGGGAHQAFLNRGEVQFGPDKALRWDSPIDVDPGAGTAWAFNLSATTTHLADMDGDGLADLVYKSADGDIFYFANLGRTAWGVRQAMSVQNSAPPAPFGQTGVRTADLDFDKRIDIVQSISTGGATAYRIWFNLGNQTYSPAVTVDQGSGFSFFDSAVQLADCNGDRLPDLARVQAQSVVVQAGLGYGRFADAIAMPLSDYTLDDVQIHRAKLTDLNGDGLADLVIERAAPGQCWYWVNLGNYTFSTRKIITGLPTGLGINAAIRWADLNGNGTTDLIYADHESSPRIQTVDLGEVLNCGATPNVLLAISNGIGRVTLIGYQPSTSFALRDAGDGHPWTNLMPITVSVVSVVTNLDSLGHQYVTRFQYHDGYYDPAEKQFRGFARTDQIEVGDSSAPTLVTRSLFDTGHAYEAMKGKLLAVSTQQEDGSVFWSTTNFWTIPPVTLYTGTNGANVAYAHPTGTVKIISELGQGTPRRLETEVAYDNFGNQTTNADFGIVENGDRTAYDDERITATQYAINVSAWILRHPARSEVKDENGSVISRVESYYDDETFAGNNLGQVIVGNLTMTRAWFAPSNSTAYVKSTRTRYDSYGNPVMQFDPLSDGSANVTQGHYREVTYDPRFHCYPTRETIHVGSGKPDLIFQGNHDEGLATVTASIDFNGNTTSYAYDAFGRLVEAIKPGDTSAFPSAEYSYALAVPAGNGRLINYVETRALDQAPESSGNKRDHYLITRQFVDGLGRKLMTRGEAEPASGSAAPRVVVTGAIQFNAREQPSRTLNPFFTLRSGSLDQLLEFESIEETGWQGQFHENGSLIALDLASAHASSREYDATLRVTRTINADGTTARTLFQPLQIQAFDENDTDPVSPHFNTPMVQVSDGLGRLIGVDEIVRLNDDGTPSLALQRWGTRYEYDLNDCLTRATDSQNNVKLMQYDGLKRRTFVNDSDAGISTHRYDDASNLLESVDAKNQRIRFTYDGVNRLLTEDYEDESSPEFSYHRSPDVRYFYDQPAGAIDQGDGARSTAQNTKGLLAYVIDASGEEHISYDARARVAWTVKRLPDPRLGNAATAGLIGYKTGFDYDSLDRLRRVVYPDNDQVTYQYNPRSLFDRITGGPSGNIISNFVYSPSSQNQQIDYGNGVRTTYAYDRRTRLSSLSTISQRSTLNAQLIQFSYTFDAVSNIKAIQDQRPTRDLSATDKRRNSQTFTYDDLYRLTRAQYNLPAAASVNGGQINYRYDRIGNMLSQTSDIIHLEKGRSVTDLGDMSYGASAGARGRIGRQPNDPAGPHALTASRNSQLETRNFPYDPSGNMTNFDGLRCTWDFKDRLVIAEDDTMRAEYTYDYADHRVVKKVISKQLTTHHGLLATLYINKYFEVRDHDQPTKYVYSGDTRVAHITGTLSSNNRIQRVRLYAGWNLLSLAVTAPDLAGQFARSLPVGAALIYKWLDQTQAYSAVAGGESLSAGAVLWVKVQTNATIPILGTYPEPTNRPVSPPGAYLAGAGLESWSLDQTLPASASAWTYDGASDRWLAKFRADLRSINSDPSELPPLAPGQAVYVQTDTPTLLEVPAAALGIRYYHEDHLGSASVLTDAQGALVEETAFYAFGIARNEYRARSVEENYKFTQKERDLESGLLYFGSRFLAGSLARFIRVDPLAADLPSQWLTAPQKLNTYAYVGNNPLKFVDPTGMDRHKPAPTPAPKAQVLVTYNEDQFKDWSTWRRTKNFRPRADFEKQLADSYSPEAGANAKIIVKRLNLKDADDLQKVFNGSSYDVWVFDGHGSGKAKQIFPGGKVVLVPEDIEKAFAGAKAIPKKMYFYGCNSAKSGFARDVSQRLPNTAVIGAGARIAPWYQPSHGHLLIEEERNYNVTYKGGAEIDDARKIKEDPTAAPIPR